MFGQQNNQDQDQPESAQIPDQAIDNVINDQAVTSPAPSSDWQHPGLPIGDNDTTPTAPASSDGGATAPAYQAASSVGDENTTAPNDLIDIKQKALNQLAPLVSHLDQSPEEKFRTTMMMIQASDNQALVKDAYAAAQEISDEKARAQALLDIVNEINYFTQQPAEN